MEAKDIIILAVVGFVGYYLYQTYYATPTTVAATTPTASASSSQVSSQPTSSTPTVPIQRSVSQRFTIQKTAIAGLGSYGWRR